LNQKMTTIKKKMNKFYNQKADIVLGLCFGDEGKGRTVDYLLSQTNNPIQDSIVVRFSGGHQVGHTVMIEGLEYNKHVHSNFGSGTLRGVTSYYTENCTFYLNTLYNEHQLLLRKGIIPKLFYHPLTMVTTPNDVAYNRVLEQRRGSFKHGTVGLGFGATIERNLKTGYKLYAIDTFNIDIFAEKLEQISNYYDKLIEGWSSADIKKYHNELMKEEMRFYGLLDYKPYRIKNYSFLKNFNYLVLEGSQGILLDKDHGIFPHVTYSNTTSKNALKLCKELNIEDVGINYVTRCYQTRHGEGWMSNTEKISLINDEHETCLPNEYQGTLKIRELDYDLLNFALDVDDIYSENLSKKLFVTCLDQRPDFQLDPNKFNRRFQKIKEFSTFFNEKFGY